MTVKGAWLHLSVRSLQQVGTVDFKVVLPFACSMGVLPTSIHFHMFPVRSRYHIVWTFIEICIPIGFQVLWDPWGSLIPHMFWICRYHIRFWRFVWWSLISLTGQADTVLTTSGMYTTILAMNMSLGLSWRWQLAALNLWTNGQSIGQSSWQVVALEKRRTKVCSCHKLCFPVILKVLLTSTIFHIGYVPGLSGNHLRPFALL
jgi:hypothetical protein